MTFLDFCSLYSIILNSFTTKSRKSPVFNYMFSKVECKMNLCHRIAFEGKQDCVYRAVCPSACVNMSQTHFPDNNGPHYPQSWREGMSSPIRAESTKSAYFDCFSAFICCEWKQWSTDHLLSHKKCAVWGLVVVCSSFL